jgi:mannosyltransferase
MATAVVRGAEPRALALAAAVVGAVAAVVSTTGSWIPSLWGDEAASVLSADRSLPSLLAMLLHVDGVHGAYYVALHFWVAMFGSSAFSVRLPSALAMGVCAAAVTWLCGRFGSLRFAVIGGIFAAALPRLTYAGEDARAYAFDAAIATVLCVIVIEILLRSAVRRRWWVAYGVALTVGIYTFLYLGLMILVAGVAILAGAEPRRRLKSWLVASLSAVVAASPLLVIAYLERKQIAFLSHRDVVTPRSVLVRMWFEALPLAIVAWSLIAIAIAGYAREMWKARRMPRPAPSLEPLAIAWLIVPMGILLAISPLVADFTARYGTFAAPAAAVLMALGVRRLVRLRGLVRVRWAAVAAAAVVVALAAPVWVGQREPYAKNHSDWNDIASTIQALSVPGDAVVFDESVRPSRRPRLAMSTKPAAFAGLVDVTLKTPYSSGVSWHDTAYTVRSAAARGRMDGISRVWVVEYITSGKRDTWALENLAALGYRRVQEIDGYRHVIYLYEK